MAGRGADVQGAEDALTREELRADNDTAGQAHIALVEGWVEVARGLGGACTVAQALAELARNEVNANSLAGNETLKYEGLRAALGELIRVPPGKAPSAHQVGLLLRNFRARPVMCCDGVLRAMVQAKLDRKNAAQWTVGVVGGIGGNASGRFEARTGNPYDRDAGPGGGSGGSGGSGGMSPAPRGEVEKIISDANASSQLLPGREAGTPPPIPSIPPTGEDELGPQWPEDLDP